MMCGSAAIYRPPWVARRVLIGRPKGANRKPKGVNRQPKGGNRNSKGANRTPKGVNRKTKNHK